MNGMIVKRGDMFSAIFDGVDSEQQGLRPFVILQNNIGNRFSPTLIVALITTKNKKDNMPTHIMLNKELGLKEDSVVMLEQIRTIDKSRIIEGSYIGRVDRATMKKIDEAMSISVGLENQRDFEVRKQVKEVEYWMRTVDDLLDDVYASQEQIKQRAVRLKMEYNKLKEICKNSRVYLSDYLVLDELKYEAILRTKEINKLKVL